MKKNIQRLLDLSTAHCPKPNPDFGDLRYADHEYGWVVWYQDPRGADAPNWLEQILLEAQRHNCMIILFDRDAPIHDELPVFDW